MKIKTAMESYENGPNSDLRDGITTEDRNEFWRTARDSLSCSSSRLELFYEYVTGKPNSLFGCSPFMQLLSPENDSAINSTKPVPPIAFHDATTRILERVRTTNAEPGPSVHWHALNVLVEWAADVELNSTVDAPGTRIIDYSSIHRGRVLRQVEPLTRQPFLDRDLNGYCCFLVCATVYLHDLGLYLGDDHYYPDLSTRPRVPDDLFRLHVRHHHVLARELLNFQRGNFPKFITQRLEALSKKTPILGEDVEKLLRESAPLLNYLLGFHDTEIDRTVLAHQATVCFSESPAVETQRQVSYRDLLYMLAILRLADSVDRTYRRVLDVSQIRELLSIGGDSEECQKKIRTCIALKLPAFLFVDHVESEFDVSNRELNILVEMRHDKKVQLSMYSLMSIISNTLKKEFDPLNNTLLKVVEERANVKIIGPNISAPHGQIESCPALYVDGEISPTARGDVSRIQHDILLDCPGYNSWIKPYRKFEHFGLLHGGEASIIGGAGDEFCEVMRRIIFDPRQLKIDLDRSTVKFDIDKRLHNALRRGDCEKEVLLNMRECIRHSNHVKSEVYVPIKGRAVVAVANVHFNEQEGGRHWKERIREFAEDLEHDLSRYGLQLMKAFREQLDTAVYTLLELWTIWGRDPNEATLSTIERAPAVPACNETCKLGDLIAAAIEQHETLQKRIIANADPDPNCLPYYPPLKKAEVMVSSKTGFIKMLGLLFEGFSHKSDCFVDYGTVKGMPLNHITIFPTSDSMKANILNIEYQRDFHSSDLFPTEVDWSDHPFDFACEARLLAALSAGQVRLGTWKIPSKSGLRSHLAESEAPGFRIELPDVKSLNRPPSESIT